MENKCGECETFSHCYPFQQEKNAACPYFQQAQPKIITNGDVIHQMSNGVFAFMMTRLILDGCPISKSKTMHDCKVSNDCVSCLTQWLDAPADCVGKDTDVLTEEREGEDD